MTHGVIHAVTVSTGLDVLIAGEFRPLSGKRVGLFTNPSAVDRQLVSAARRFKAASAAGASADDTFRLAALFAPEHGIDAAAPDGQQIASSREGDLPVYSLYGETQCPTAAMLAGLDVLVCDLQDIGVRYYTFLWTLTHILEAAGEFGVPVLVLDRPNPLGGEIVSGAPLDPALASLVGRCSIPIQHGMTLGEVARWFNDRWNPTPAALEVIACAGWRRSMRWRDTGLAFVPPSPNMPHPETVAQYPGACLIEGTNLSEGRGTALPFEIAGAPFVEGAALADHLNALDLPGVRFRPHTFQPTASKWADESCGGVQVHITDAAAFRAIPTWLHVIAAARARYPDQFAWLPDHFDRLIGSREVRTRIDAGDRLDDLLAAWENFTQNFRRERQPYLLYE